MASKKFTNKQKEIVARRLGYDGPMQGFDEFLRSNPALQRRYGTVVERYMAKGGAVTKKPVKMLTGGIITNAIQNNLDAIKQVVNPTTTPTIVGTANPTPITTTPLPEAAGQAQEGGNVPGEGEVGIHPVSPPEETTTTPTQPQMPAIPAVPTVTAATAEAPVISGAAGQAPEATLAPTYYAQAAPEVTAPAAVGAPTYTAAQATPELQQQLEGVQAAQGQVRPEALVQAQTQVPTTTAVGQVQAAQIAPGEGVQVKEVTPEMTVAGQLGKLTEDFDATKPPAWAAGAMRTATAQMAARGLGTSSLAGQAIVQAVLESGIPIAAQDAATNVQVAIENARLAQTTDLANLNNRQAVVLAKAAQIASLETQNLSNMQQAAVANAQAFLQMDLTNLGYEQQTSLFKAQEMAQALLTDTAASNAALQFNATSQLQADQFNANLATQVAQFNTTQMNAVNQFNASSANALSQFNASQQNARDQFNAQNALVVAQANAQLLAQVSLANTASINAANQFNAQAALGISTTAYNAQVQVMRDNMQYAWQTGENALSREMELAKTRISTEATRYAADRGVDAAMYEALGAMGAKILQTGASPGTLIGDLKGALTAGTKAIMAFISGGPESTGYTLLTDYITDDPTAPNFGWEYYTDDSNNSVVISPNNEYYFNGELVWTPTMDSYQASGGFDYWGGSD